MDNDWRFVDNLTAIISYVVHYTKASKYLENLNEQHDTHNVSLKWKFRVENIDWHLLYRLFNKSLYIFSNYIRKKLFHFPHTISYNQQKLLPSVSLSWIIGNTLQLFFCYRLFIFPRLWKLNFCIDNFFVSSLNYFFHRLYFLFSFFFFFIVYKKI